MNKYIATTLYLFIILFFVNCGSTHKNQLRSDIENYKTEGWLDDETFQVKGIGSPNSNSRGFVRRRTQAKEAALLSAQKRVVELMVGSVITSSSESESGVSKGIKVSKKIAGFIRGGQIVQESYDEEDNCELVFRISGRSLKKKVEALAEKQVSK